MKKKSIFLLLMVLFTCCSSSDNAPVETEKPGTSEPEETTFTSADATLAIDAFNTLFYDKDFGVYYASSAREKRAAIWTQAIYWDMVMNAYQRTKDQKYLTLIEDIYQGAGRQYANYDWSNTVEWFIYDDIMWWVISFARAYEITGEEKYLAHSKSGFDRVWNGLPGVDDGAYDPERGGLYWGWKPDQRGKTACINYPAVIAAMTLYNITGSEDYLNNALEVYQWSRETLFDKQDGKVGDHQVPGNPTNWTTNLYNQATCIGSAMMLYNKTGEKTYLNDAILAANYSRDKMSDSDGMIYYKTGIEQGIYTAIFSQYIVRLIEDGKQPQYLPWLRYNINTAWGNRDKARNLTYKNIKVPCPTRLIEVYDASGCPALMQVIAPEQQ